MTDFATRATAHDSRDDQAASDATIYRGVEWRDLGWAALNLIAFSTLLLIWANWA